jgi:hypothetical protein
MFRGALRRWILPPPEAQSCKSRPAHADFDQSVSNIGVMPKDSGVKRSIGELTRYTQFCRPIHALASAALRMPVDVSKYYPFS